MSQPSSSNGRQDRRKSEKRSMVWLYFEELSELSAKCNACRAKLSYQGGSPSNLKKHLVIHQPHDLASEPTPARQRVDGETKIQPPSENSQQAANDQLSTANSGTSERSSTDSTGLLQFCIY